MVNAASQVVGLDSPVTTSPTSKDVRGSRDARTTFLHIPKTAGTTVLDVMRLWYEPKAVCPSVFENDLRSLPDRTSYRLYSGHFGFEAIQELIPGTRIFSFIRNPRARIASLYRYWRAHPWDWVNTQDPRHTQHVRYAKTHSFLDTIRSQAPFILGTMDNSYIRHFVPRNLYRGDNTLAVSEERAYEIAITNAQQLFFIGIVENFSESMCLLAQLMGQQPIDHLPNRNNAGDGYSRPDRGSVKLVADDAELDQGPEVNAELERLTALDQRFYDSCLAEYQRLKAVQEAKQVQSAPQHIGTMFSDRGRPVSSSTPPGVHSMSPCVFVGCTVADWLAYEEGNSWVTSQVVRSSMLREIEEIGCYPTEFLSPVPRVSPVVRSNNFREGLYVSGLNSRERASLLSLFRNTEESDRPTLRLYVPEHGTRLSGYLAEKFEGFISREFVTTFANGEQDIPMLFTKPPESGSIDAILTSDFFPHVPIDETIGAAAAALPDGGLLISTMPFFFRRPVGEQKAHIENGQVLLPHTPVYHQNPISGSGKSLVLEIPGWDIVKRLKAHFRDAWIELYSSTKFGILGGTDVNGVFVVVALK